MVQAEKVLCKTKHRRAQHWNRLILQTQQILSQSFYPLIGSLTVSDKPSFLHSIETRRSVISTRHAIFTPQEQVVVLD